MNNNSYVCTICDFDLYVSIVFKKMWQVYDLIMVENQMETSKWK